MTQSVQVEFFGIPRLRAGVASAEVTAGSLGSVLEELAERFPQLAESCLEQGRLRRGYAANLNGERFIQSPEVPVQEGDCLLILSSDAGG